ncbi:hypothetical protein V7166_12225 [Bacillus thuringiensis]|jgi:hypothetical protein|nr:hypothetical protein [Bacillus sp. 123MFChir2]
MLCISTTGTHPAEIRWSSNLQNYKEIVFYIVHMQYKGPKKLGVDLFD